MDYPLPANEAGRLVALEACAIFGTEPEAAFDDLTELAAQLTGAPICTVNLVGKETIWIKSRHGMPPSLAEVPRGAVCCSRVVCRTDLMVVPDTLADPEFRSLPFIATEPFVRFYAGMPLIDSGGYALGTLCIMGLEPRELTFELAEGIRRLARQAVAQMELRLKLSELERTQAALTDEKARADQLIRNILPAGIAKELIEKGSVAPAFHPSTTIMFTDFVGFSKSAEVTAPRELIDDLHGFFSAFDEIVARHGLEKLKTIGDAYLCVGGLKPGVKDHAAQICLAALAIRDFMQADAERRRITARAPWQLRVGVHSGSLISGVVGRDKFAYDVWGDAVNIASRMESAGEAGRINISEPTYQAVKAWFDCTPPRSIEVKNKGSLQMRFLDRLKPEFSANAAGTVANDRLKQALTGTTMIWALPG